MKREKDGGELAVRMVAYPHRPGLAIMQPVMEGLRDAVGNYKMRSCLHDAVINAAVRIGKNINKLELYRHALLEE